MHIAIFCCITTEHNTSISISVISVDFGCKASAKSFKNFSGTVFPYTVASFGRCTVDLVTVLPVAVLSSTAASLAVCKVVLLSYSILKF